MADLTPDQDAALKAELTVNPLKLTYGGKNSVDVAALLNTTAASNGRVQGAGVVSTQALMNCIVVADWLKLSVQGQQQLAFWFSVGSLDTANPNVREAITGVFGAGDVSQTNLLAAIDTPISRGEALFGPGTVINYWDVDRALALP